MGVLSSAGRAVGAFAFLALVGFLAVALAGPVLALIAGLLSLVIGLIAATLPFALIGLAVWAVYRLVAAGPRGAWRDLGLRAAQVAYWVVAIPLIGLIRLTKGGLWAGRGLTALGLSAARGAGRAARDCLVAGGSVIGRGATATGTTLASLRPVGRFANMLLEMFGGAAVGAVLVCVATLGERGVATALPIVSGAVAGALIGLFVGAARQSFAPESGVR